MQSKTKEGKKAQGTRELTVPIYSPRTTQNNIRTNDELLLQDLTLNFDPFTINILKNEFKVRKGEMKLEEFIIIIKEHLMNWQVDLPFREKRLSKILHMLFEEIDMNGNGVLEWDEFTNYIIEKATVLKNVKQKAEEIKTYTPAHVKLARKFNNLLSKSLYLSEIDKILILEEGSNELFMVNHETGAINPKPLVVGPPPIEDALTAKNVDAEGKPVTRAEKPMVLDMIYVKDKDNYYLMTSSNDRVIRTWRYTSNGFVNIALDSPDYIPGEDGLKFKDPQLCIAWDESNSLLYSGQEDGCIHIWDKKSDTIIAKLDADKGGHEDVVMQMIPLPKLQLLATCSLDKTVILWNTIDKKRHKIYREHTRGVVTLAFNESLILLLSGGYDHLICVFNPYISTCVFRIQTHMFPIVALTNVEGTNHFVSLDSAGNVKIWDYKKFGCLQSFSIETDDEKHKFHAQCLTYIPKPLKLVFSGRNLNIYDYDKNYNPTTVDDSVVVGIGYRPANNTIITPAGNKIKVWNALNGEVKKIFSDISQTAEVTCFTLDHYKKRCLIGFSDGEAAVFNVQNGAKLKTLSRHSAEVNFIMEMHDPNPEHNQIITASISENLIKFHLDNDINESELIRKIDIRDSTEMRDSSLSAIAYRPGKGDKFMKLFFVGTHSGFIGFFEAETTKNLGQCFPFPGEEITAIMPHHELDYILVTTSAGKCGIIACPPLPYRFQTVWSFANLDPESKLPNYINNAIWSNRKRYLFISDEKFYIRCYDLSKPIEELIQDKKEKMRKDNSSNSKTHLYAPSISKDHPNCLWITKAHSDPIRVMEYVEDEDLIFTSGIDKKVKIFNSMNGKFIESLQQKYDKFEPIPIAYKKPGISGIWHPNLYERVDKEYVNKKKLEEMLHQEQASENPFTKLLQRNMMEQQQKEQKLSRSASKQSYMNSNRNLKSNAKQTPQSQVIPRNEEIATMGADKDPRGELHRAASKILINHIMNNMGSQDQDNERVMEEVEREESDPYYNFIQIEHSMLPTSNSSYWKLKVDFDTERREVEKRLRDMKDKIEKLEEEMHERDKKEGLIEKLHAMENNDGEDNHYLDPNLEEAKRKEEHDRVLIENMKAMMTKTKEGLVIKGQMNYQEETKYVNVKPKVNQINSGLHRKVLKGKMLDKNKPIVSLTKDEVDAAYRLAAVLSNYDSEDTRNLKFLEVKQKTEGRFNKSTKNFIDLNRQRISYFSSPVKSPSHNMDGLTSPNKKY